MNGAALPLHPAIEAIAVVAGALWMTLAPQSSPAAHRRGLLGALTWAGSRALLLALAHADARALVLPLAADLVAWRALAYAEGEAAEAPWAWAATPAVALLALRAGAPAACGAAAVALAFALVRRRLALAAGLALGGAAAFAGPWLVAPALALALGAARRPARVAALLVPVAGALVVGRFGTWAGAWPEAIAAPVAGAGPTLWRVPFALGVAVPAWIAWGIVLALAAWGAWRLVRRGEGDAAIGAWAFAAFATCAPGADAAHLVAWLPLLVAWCAGDPDRRGWWILEGLALPIAFVLEGAPLSGAWGPLWRAMAMAGLLGAGALALWPLHALHARPVAARTPRAPGDTPRG